MKCDYGDTYTFHIYFGKKENLSQIVLNNRALLWRVIIGHMSIQWFMNGHLLSSHSLMKIMQVRPGNPNPVNQKALLISQNCNDQGSCTHMLERAGVSGMMVSPACRCLYLTTCLCQFIQPISEEHE